MPKVKLFYWLGLHGRLWTGDRRKRHGLQDDDLCALCDQASETTDHLLLSCVYSREVWFRILTRCGRNMNMLAPTDTDLLLSWWLQSREALPESFRRGFDSLTMLVTWAFGRRDAGGSSRGSSARRKG